jgi:hypothetical protein
VAAAFWVVTAFLLAASPVAAHSIAGDRIFPATLAVDDPGVGDEADMTYGRMRVPGDDGEQRVNALSFAYAKRITSNLALSVDGAYVMQNHPNAKGFDNLGVGLKSLLYVNPEHEFMTSVGVSAELGGTGSRAIASRFSTLSPMLYMGKGMGDLPDALAYLRPLAITAAAGPALARGAGQPNAFNYGFTLQYSIPYLRQQVRDFNPPQPLSNLIPIVEASLSRSAGQTTGTINPGIIWASRLGQLGIEAQIPVNRASGSGAGVLVQFHVFFDDIAPRTLGKPLF